MLPSMVKSPRSDEPRILVQQKYYSIKELADELGKEYRDIYFFVKRHNKLHPDAPIIPVKMEHLGRKVFLRSKDAEAIRDRFLHPEHYEEPAW